MFAKALNAKRFAQYIGMLIFCGMVSASDISDADRSDADRLTIADSYHCDNTVSDYVDEISEVLAQAPSGLDAVSTAVVLHVCDAKKVSAHPPSFITDSLSESVELTLLFAATKASQYWLFAFRNDKNITNEVFGQRNLLSVKEGEVEPILLHVPKSNRASQVVSIIAVDASNRARSVLPGNTTGAMAVLYGKTISNSFEIDYVDAVEAKIDPSPNYLSLGQERVGESVDQELVFSTESRYQQLSVIPIKTKVGALGNVVCGDTTSEIINIKLDEWKSASIRCTIEDDISELVFIYLADYFTPVSNAGIVNFTGPTGVSPINVFH